MTWQCLMEPPACTPKNDVLIGIPGYGFPRGGRSSPGGGLGTSAEEEEEEEEALSRGGWAGDAGGGAGGGGGGGVSDCVGWMAAAAKEYEAGLMETAETPSAVVFASLLDGG